MSFVGLAVSSYRTTNTGLPFYEFPGSSISALLGRLEPSSSNPKTMVWVDVTSNRSKSLPTEYPNSSQSTLSGTTVMAVPWNPPFVVLGEPFKGDGGNVTASATAVTAAMHFGPQYGYFKIQAFAAIFYDG